MVNHPARPRRLQGSGIGVPGDDARRGTGTAQGQEQGAADQTDAEKNQSHICLREERAAPAARGERTAKDRGTYLKEASCRTRFGGSKPLRNRREEKRFLGTAPPLRGSRQDEGASPMSR
ncbi:MAG: hypothetical protein OXU61_12310, partial [Gammaproteobacteria bacterium]|nr:hypothetical protein [Gammaproteobacteria bacterium]